MTGEGLFATLVIMAVVTTLMASPLFDRLVGSERTRVRPLEGSFAKARWGRSYLWKRPKVKPHSQQNLWRTFRWDNRRLGRAEKWGALF